MSEEFLSNCASDTPLPPPYNAMQRERIKHVLYGSKSAIAHTIHQLHLRGYAETGAWSRPQPTGTPGEYMSILLRTLLI